MLCSLVEEQVWILGDERPLYGKEVVEGLAGLGSVEGVKDDTEDGGKE